MSHHTSRRVRALIMGAALVVAAHPAHAAAACEGLTALTASPGGAPLQVTLAKSVAAGAFTAPGPDGPPAAASPYGSLPAFCRVAITLRPGPKSDVKAEVWMPASGWNGKLQVVGNGGFAGTIGYRALATALASGFAAASTDTGHTGPAANTFATEDATLDFAYRAIHETAVAAKQAVDGFYGAAPKFSYFNGCSTGGRQALTAAQRYPDDFAGIVGGAPAIYTTKQAFGQLWFYQAIAVSEGAIPKEKLPLIHDAVLAACDALDGAADGVLENPLACKFDPGVLACKPGAAPASCLTPPQVESVRKIYAGASHAATGEKIFPGLERGSELGWSPVPVSYAVGRPRPRVYGDEAPLSERTDPNAARSFFSGHAGNCLATTIVATTALHRIGRPRLAWAVLAVGLAGSALVGVSRVAAGGHFPSDVFVGYAVGAGVGIAVPALHGLSVRASPLAFPGAGLSLSGRF